MILAVFDGFNILATKGLASHTINWVKPDFLLRVNGSE
jgi:hypothetical protein